VERDVDLDVEADQGIAVLHAAALALEELEVDLPVDLLRIRVLLESEDDAPSTVLCVDDEMCLIS
jgi:hypothetical protein